MLIIKIYKPKNPKPKIEKKDDSQGSQVKPNNVNPL